MPILYVFVFCASITVPDAIKSQREFGKVFCTKHGVMPCEINHFSKRKSEM